MLAVAVLMLAVKWQLHNAAGYQLKAGQLGNRGSAEDHGGQYLWLKRNPGF